MGRKYTIEHMLSFFFRYVWVICALILFCELVFTGHSAYVFLQKSAADIAVTTQRELEHQISVTWKLGEALSQDKVFSNPEISLEERALYLKPYNSVYELFLIGITDKAGKITSTYDDIPGEIGQRDYFQRVVSTGKAEITDAFAAGADGVTKNYTICVPYTDKNGAVIGTIIMSIPFTGVNDTITRTLPGSDYSFTLFGSANTIMAEREEHLLGKTFMELAGESVWMSQNIDKVADSVARGEQGSYWTLDNGRLLYVVYAPVPPTSWKLFTVVNALSSVQPILLSFLLKATLYLCLFGCISCFGRTYIHGKLKDINVLVRKVVDLQYELRNKNLLVGTELDEVMEMSQKGLVDDLTGLPTRAVFLRQLKLSLRLADINQLAVLLVIDLDDLKHINDSGGHEAGDKALKAVGKCLEQYAEQRGALVGRFGGDEFLVYLPLQGLDCLQAELETLIVMLRLRIPCAGQEMDIHTSIGAALHPRDSQDFDTLYSKADSALYTSKRAGKNQFHVWQQEDGGNSFSG